MLDEKYNYFFNCLIYIINILASHSTPHILFKSKHINKHIKYILFFILRLPFHFHYISFEKQKDFNFDRIQYINIFSFMERYLFFFFYFLSNTYWPQSVGIFMHIFIFFVAGGLILHMIFKTNMLLFTSSLFMWYLNNFKRNLITSNLPCCHKWEPLYSG